MANSYGGKGVGLVLQPSIQTSTWQQQQQQSLPCCRQLVRGRGPFLLHKNQAAGALSPHTVKTLAPVKVASRPYVRNRCPVSCSGVRGSSAANPSSSVDSPGARRRNEGAAPTTSERRPKTLLRFPELTESGRGTSDLWEGNRNSLKEDPWLNLENGLHMQQVDNTLVENKGGELFDTVVKELNSGKDPDLLNESGRVSWKEEAAHGIPQQKRTGVYHILANDMDVIRGGISWMEQLFLPATKEVEVRGGHMVQGRDTWRGSVQKRAQSLQRKTGVLNILARDVETIQEGLSFTVQNAQIVVQNAQIVVQNAQIVFPNMKEEVKTKSHSAKEGYRVSEFQTQKASALRKLKEGVSLLNGVKDGLVKAGEPLLKWGEAVGKRTGVHKIIERDLEVIQEGISLATEEVKEILRIRLWEDSSAPVETLPPWPQPVYYGLSGKDVLAADIEILQSYGNYMRVYLNTWRIPLQLSYDPEGLASYFNRRPHLLIFRLLEVSAAFSGVALQLLLDQASLFGDQFGLLSRSESRHSTLKSAEALKKTLLGLGPTFIKVAQSLSSRPDLIGTNTAKVLSELQDRLPPFPTEDAMAVIEEELGVPTSQVFSYLSEDPVAAASLGQVYKGCTLEGEEVAVKVQRPDLLFDVARDIYVLRVGLRMLRKVARINSDISLLADELGHALFGELDYTLEAANAKEFASLHRDLSYVKVPRTLPHLTRKRVLTMEWINGDRPLDLKLIADGNDLKGGLASMTQRQDAKHRLDALVRKGVECSLVQLLDTGVMHADPHPGNLLYTREGLLAYLDFGLLARVEKKHQAAMLAVIAHLVNGEWQCLANDFADLGILKPSTDRFALRLALERAFGEGPDAVVRNGVPDIQFGQVTGKLWKIALKFRFRLPPYYTLVLRSLSSLEGIAVSVDPNYKVFAAAYPYVVRRLLSDNSLPSRRVLKSLVLTQKGEFRWDRIAAIMATSRKASPESVGQRTAPLLPANLDASQPEEVLSTPGRDVASQLLFFTLSKEGTSVRRVLLEADTKSLGQAFVSPPATALKRKVSYALAKTFYLSILTSTKDLEANWSSTSTGVGHSRGRMNENTAEVAAAELPAPNLPGAAKSESKNSSPLSATPSLNYQRLWFLLKVFSSRLRSSPFLLLKVSWAFVTMVGFAAALALHEYAITLSDRLLSVDSKKTPKRIHRRADQDTNLQLQASSVYSSSV